MLDGYARNRRAKKEELIENAHFEDEQHDYGVSKRRAMYAFLQKHCGLRSAPASDLEVEIEPQSSMLVFGPDHPRPEHALPANSRVTLPRP